MNTQKLTMQCEKGNCNNALGKDYKRKTNDPNWKDEPIYLCDEHGKGFEVFE